MQPKLRYLLIIEAALLGLATVLGVVAEHAGR
jgi:hypothetical protein